MKIRYPFLLLLVAELALAAIPLACGSYSSGEHGVGGNVGSSDPSAGAGGGNNSCLTPVDNDDTVPPFGGIPLPCDVFSQGGTKCATAHSTVRVIVAGYEGPLYQLCKGGSSAGPSSCKGTTQDIKAIDGYADVATHDGFCGDDSCVITKIYDQSGNGSDLEPSPKGGAKPTADNPAKASALPVKVNGHSAYGILIKQGMGYRTGCGGCNIKQAKGMAIGDEPQSMYMVTSQYDLVDGCCFDYGNAETTSNDDGNGTMEAVYFGAGVVWGTGFGGKPGPWVMGDLENGVFAGWENGQDKLISTNKPLKFDFVTAVVVGDTYEKNCGKGRYMLYGADATGADATYGKLMTMYDGVRPEKPGYVPMQKQGSLILGTGGDNSSGGAGRFYEGATATGLPISKKTANLLQAAIAATKYETP
jgi:non-reducing end alpha-L-arabinofuranosidase